MSHDPKPAQRPSRGHVAVIPIVAASLGAFGLGALVPAANLLASGVPAWAAVLPVLLGAGLGRLAVRGNLGWLLLLSPPAIPLMRAATHWIDGGAGEVPGGIVDVFLLTLMATLIGHAAVALVQVARGDAVAV